MATASTGYSPGGSSPGPTAVGDTETDASGFWSLAKCRQAYTAYLDSKRLEIEEQQQARRYRHGVQWTAEQIKVLNDRKQPVVTYNKIGRKIDGDGRDRRTTETGPQGVSAHAAAPGRRRPRHRRAALLDGPE